MVECKCSKDSMDQSLRGKKWFESYNQAVYRSLELTSKSFYLCLKVAITQLRAMFTLSSYSSHAISQEMMY